MHKELWLEYFGICGIAAKFSIPIAGISEILELFANTLE